MQDDPEMIDIVSLEPNTKEMYGAYTVSFYINASVRNRNVEIFFKESWKITDISMNIVQPDSNNIN